VAVVVVQIPKNKIASSKKKNETIEEGRKTPQQQQQ
jgi:hypothetical protein